jgi:hypothetical protein
MSMWADTQDLHGPRFAHKLGFLVFTSLVIKLFATSSNCLCGSVTNDYGLYHRVWVGSGQTLKLQKKKVFLNFV